MTAQLFLVDSNSYLRLARHIPNLLGIHGAYELRVLPRFDEEYLRSPRLQNKFTWPADPPHPSERAKWSLAITSKQAKTIKNSEQTIMEFAEATLSEKFGHKRKIGKDGKVLTILSPQDLRLMCHAIELNIGIVTDELPMTFLAKRYDLFVISSLGILRYLLGLKEVSMANVEAIVRYWQFDKDVPTRDWDVKYKRLFKKDPPLIE